MNWYFYLADVGRLVHCALAGMGEGDIAKIRIFGENLAGCRNSFRPADDFEKIRNHR